MKLGSVRNLELIRPPETETINDDYLVREFEQNFKKLFLIRKYALINFLEEHKAMVSADLLNAYLAPAPAEEIVKKLSATTPWLTRSIGGVRRFGIEPALDDEFQGRVFEQTLAVVGQQEGAEKKVKDFLFQTDAILGSRLAGFCVASDVQEMLTASVFLKQVLGSDPREDIRRGVLSVLAAIYLEAKQPIPKKIILLLGAEQVQIIQDDFLAAAEPEEDGEQTKAQLKRMNDFISDKTNFGKDEATDLRFLLARKKAAIARVESSLDAFIDVRYGDAAVKQEKAAKWLAGRTDVYDLVDQLLALDTEIGKKLLG